MAGDVQGWLRDRYRARWSQRLERLLAFGTETYPTQVRRRLKILNAMAYLIAVFSSFFALSYALKDAETYAGVIAINIGLVVVALLVPFAHRLHELAGGLMIGAAEYAALFGLVAIVGRSSGIQLNLIVAAAAGFVVLGLDRIRLIVSVVALAFVLHVAAWFLFPHGMPGFDDDAFRAQLYVTSAFTAFAAITIIVYYAFRLAQRAEAETEALLRNTLPDSIVERLKAHPGEPIADSVPEASILFADLKGFVRLSIVLGAARTVAMLNDLVTAFDALAAKHGVEKIKTIGDAYMAAAGLPEPVPDHAARAARLALDMVEMTKATAARFDVDLKLRVGLASGPVMAGIIGTRKFTYDVWGYAVNLASRLEGAGEPGRIHVSPEVRAALASSFDFAPRGPVDIKGVGPLETWFLVGPRAAVEASAA